MASVIGDMSFRFRIPSVFATSVAEIDGLRDAAAHSLHPEIHAWEVGRNIVARHNHLGGKRLVVAVAGPIEVGLEYDRCVAGHGCFVARRPRAFEARSVQQLRRIPADTFVVKAGAWIVWIDADAQGALPNGVDAGEAAARVDNRRAGFVGAAASQKYLPRREAADASVEAKPDAALRPCGEWCRNRRGRVGCRAV